MWVAKLTVQIRFNRLMFCFIRLAESRVLFETNPLKPLGDLLELEGLLQQSHPSIPKFKRLGEEAWLEFGLKVKRLSLSSPMSLSSSNGIGLEKLCNCFKRG
ncbi:unnamed protein product [Arabidopsis thaliana]|uniref:Uncharacterized protein n=1 Tax=Arabidopsis thaliana TaxID=3702 RepID=A0A5S9XSS1_ARATH|nr:unnamed protein product [Arabidopsis thaliana]